jgi:hypothetical protein
MLCRGLDGSEAPRSYPIQPLELADRTTAANAEFSFDAGGMELGVVMKETNQSGLPDSMPFCGETTKGPKQIHAEISA